MWWKLWKTGGDRDVVIERTERILSKWNLLASDTGVLVLQPRGPALGPTDLVELMEGLDFRSDRLGFREIVFDLQGVNQLARPWTLVLALMIRFGRMMHAQCRLVGMTGQPEHVINMYRAAKGKEAEIAGMTAEPPTDHPSMTRAKAG